MSLDQVNEGVNKNRKPLGKKAAAMRPLIAQCAENARRICHEHGLLSIDKACIVLRDSTNPEMYIIVSNDDAKEVARLILFEAQP